MCTCVYGWMGMVGGRVSRVCHDGPSDNDLISPCTHTHTTHAAPRSRWALDPYPTPFWRGSRTTKTWASIPKCSRTGSSPSCGTATSTTSARPCTRAGSSRCVVVVLVAPAPPPPRTQHQTTFSSHPPPSLLPHPLQSFCSGTRKLYDFIDDNPLVQFLDVALVNNTHVISQQPNMTAINSCVEIDLTVRTYVLTHHHPFHTHTHTTILLTQNQIQIRIQTHRARSSPTPSANESTPAWAARHVHHRYAPWTNPSHPTPRMH